MGWYQARLRMLGTLAIAVILGHHRNIILQIT